METKKTRLFVQLFFFLFVLIATIAHTLEEGGVILGFLPSSSIHGVCPMGGLETLYRFVTEGRYIQKIHESSFILMNITLILSLFFGAVFCGWVCPLGTLQEWFGKVGKRIFKSKYNTFIPYKYDRYLRYLRYIFLTWVLFMTYESGKLFFNDIDPIAALFHLWSSELATGGALILLVTVIGSLFIERPWCKYLCPFGAVLGVFNIFRVFKIRRKESTCISCNKCTRECPMNIKVSNSKTVKNHQCITCMKCTSEEMCPIKDTVVLSVGKEV